MKTTKVPTEILYVEDDINLSMVVNDFLQMQNYKVHHFESAEGVIAQWENFNAEICILDVMLPKKNGFELAKFIREKNTHIPIVFLSAKDQTEDRIQGFEVGADDYVIKPFSTIELDLRIKAILKRVGTLKEKLSDKKPPLQIELGRIFYNEAELSISSEGKIINLTKKENLLLKTLISNNNQVVKRDDLLISIWGENNHKNSRSMDVYLSKLRKIISCEPRISIVNYHGTGFKLDTTQL